MKEFVTNVIISLVLPIEQAGSGPGDGGERGAQVVSSGPTASANRSTSDRSLFLLPDGRAGVYVVRRDNVATTRSGYVRWYGVSNYFEVQVSEKSYVTFRNEALRDEQGQRTGFATWYSTHTLGWVYKPNNVVILRPEIKYSHAYSANAYDQPESLITGSRGPGTRNNQFEVTFDIIFRF
jgi:hypothetical protein